MTEVKLHVQDLGSFFAEAKRMGRQIDQGHGAAESAEIAFETMETLLKVLTPNRWALLRTLRQRGPSSIRALSKVLGRDYRGVHADVMALIDAGLIEKDADGLVRVPWDRITAEMSIGLAA